MIVTELVSIVLFLTGLLMIVAHRIKVRRERLRPTLHQRLFASHLMSGLHRTR